MKKYKKRKKRYTFKKNSKNKYNFKIPIKIKIKLYSYLILSIFILIISLFIYQFEAEVVPTAIKISEKYVTNVISQEIDKSVEKTIEEMQLYSGKLFSKNITENNQNFIDINTILINNVCLNVSHKLTENLNKLSKTEIELPIGVFSGFNIFSDLGPNFKINVSSIGDAIVDYETKFESVGINQINFQVYLNINTKVAIVNPVYKKDIQISRKLMLVNTVFNGEVPNTYLQIPNNK